MRMALPFSHCLSREERDQVLRPMAEDGQEATGSMGDDTPMAVLSQKVRHVADYFRQQFAQVTNPPIDPLRESIVMSLETCIGAEKNVFEETPDHAHRVILTSPVLSPLKFIGLRDLESPAFQNVTLSMAYDAGTSLQDAINQLADQAEDAIRSGKVVLILSDKEVHDGQLLIG